MTEFLLKFFNISTSGSARVTGSELVLTSGVRDIWLLLLAIGLGVLSYMLYRREEGVARWKRLTMTGMRIGLFVLLLLLIARPVVRFTLEGDIRKAILILVDSSASMSIEDPRTEALDQQRALIATGAIDPGAELDDKPPATQPASMSRLELVRRGLANSKLDLLNRLKKDYDLRAVSFGDQLFDIPVESDQTVAAALEKVKADRSTTALGDAVRTAITKSRGQPLAGLFVISDGSTNAGSNPLAAAELASREGVPVYAWGVGITNPKDIAVASIFSRDVAFIDDELPVVARLRTSGLGGQSIKVVAKLNDQIVGDKTVKIEGDGEELVTIPVTPDKPGQYKLTISVDPLASEAVADNNQQSQDLRVVDGKIRVLYIDQQPRWDFKYLQAMLLRDRRLEAKFVLLEADKSLAEVKDSPYLKDVPSEKDELFKYDLIIIGDVDPGVLSRQQLDILDEFVSKFGGAVVMLAGKRFAPEKYFGTPLADMLPVEWEQVPAGPDAGVAHNTPVAIELTPAGKASAVLRLAEDEKDSAKLWAELPPIYWTARVTRAKPAAEVLVVDSDPAKATRFGKMPIIAQQQYGLGTTLFIGTDNLWRWRKNAGDSHYTRIWGQIIQRLALPHLLGESRRTQLVSDKKSYSIGDRMTVYARLYTERYEPLADASVAGALKDEAGNTTRIILRQMPGQPGMYRAEITASAAGNYTMNVEIDPEVKLDLPVTAPKLEFADTAMNESLLRQIAGTSRGQFFREEDLYTLPDSIQSRAEKIKSSVDVEIWSSPVFFILMLLLAGAEWVLRKTAYLK